MKAILYDLELKAPVLATDIQGEPNSAVSLPYLPGALLRGAVVGRYLQQQGKQEFDAEDSVARALFLNETTRYLNAYPLDKQGRRALPLLKSWRYKKDDIPKVDDLEKKRRIHCLEAVPPEDGFREEKIGEPFGWLEKTTVHRFGPARQLNVHTRRNARKGRATEDSGDIYRYDALAAGLKLQAIIWTADEHVQTLTGLLRDATLWIGRARRAGYGEVRVTEVHEPQDDWRELNANEWPDAVEQNGYLQVALFSPALLRDEYGRAVLDPVGAIESELGLPSGSLIAQSEYAFADTMLVGGFNRKWGLSLPQHQALAAGSYFTYRCQAAISQEALAKLEQQGVGERRNEGYGQVIFNWLASATERETQETLQSQTAASQSQVMLEPLNEEEKAIATSLAKTILQRQVEAELQRRINTTHLEAKPGRQMPNNHQLARLRVEIRKLRRHLTGTQQSELVLQLFEDYLKQANDRQVSAALNNAQIREGSVGTPLPDWMLGQLRDATKQWSSHKIKLGDNSVAYQATVDEKLATEFALRLIDRVLHRAQKEDNGNG